MPTKAARAEMARAKALSRKSKPLRAMPKTPPKPDLSGRAKRRGGIWGKV